MIGGQESLMPEHRNLLQQESILEGESADLGTRMNKAVRNHRFPEAREMEKRVKKIKDELFEIRVKLAKFI